MDGFQGRDGFHFHHNSVFDHEIEAVARIEHHSFVHERQRLLSNETQLTPLGSFSAHLLRTCS